MTNNNDKLVSLYEKVAKKRKAEVELEDLMLQEEELYEKVEGLKERKDIEQRDVEKLEGRSLAAFFYNVIGKKEEKLEKEKREAYEAAVKYDAIAFQYESIKRGIEQRKAVINELHGCEEQYEKAMAEAAKRIRESGNSYGAEIMKLQEEMNYLKSQNRECDEAIAAGEDAIEEALDVKSSLDSASSWNTWDVFGGGGIITHMAKYDHLDDAQEKIEKLQVRLSEFKTELTDVHISADIKVEIDGFTRFVDYFFDNIFTDWEVGGKIDDALSQVNSTIQSIENVIEELEEMKNSNMDKLQELNGKVEKIVLMNN